MERHHLLLSLAMVLVLHWMPSAAPAAAPLADDAVVAESSAVQGNAQIEGEPYAKSPRQTRLPGIQKTRDPGVVQYAEVEITLSDSMRVADLRALPLAPGCTPELLEDPLRARVQIPVSFIKCLEQEGVRLREIRRLALIESPRSVDAGKAEAGGDILKALASPEYGSNSSNVSIPDYGPWVYSPITISGAPGGSVVVSIDVHYEIIHTYISDLQVDLTDDAISVEYTLWDHEGGSGHNINETETGITAFNGKLVNQEWDLWAIDDASLDTGYIDTWWIKVYYPSVPEDDYEQNDTRGAAYSLATHEQTWLATIDGIGVQLDDDWYALYMTPGDDHLVVDCRFSHSAGNINIELYNSSGTVVAFSRSTSDNEYINTPLPTGGGNYYVRVYGPNIGTTYDLWWDDQYTGATPPPTPTGVNAETGIIPGQINLSWNASSGATGYRVYYDEDATAPPFTPANNGNPGSGGSVGNVTSVVISSLTAGQTYHCAVTAYNASAESPFSTQDSATACAALAGTRRAVLVGIDHYDPDYIWGGDLPSCVNDATDTRGGLLADGAGRWRAGKMQLLTNGAATKAAIRNAMHNLADISGPGDLVVYYQSSHGGQYSGTSTYLCTYNADYSDTDLAADLALFDPATTVIVIVDACHSGGLFKGETEWLFAENVMAEYKKIKTAEAKAKGLATPKAFGTNIAFMTACDYDETCWAGNPYSLYAGYIIAAFNAPSSDTNGDGDCAFWELHTYARTRAAADNPSQNAQHYNRDLLESIPARTNGIDDKYEDNDTAAAAYDLSSYEGTWLSAIDGLGRIWDADWFRIYVAPGHERVLIDCRFTDANGNINLAFYDHLGLDPPLAVSTTTTDNEYIDCTVPPGGGTFYIKVYHSSVGNTYNLRWDTLQPSTLQFKSATYSVDEDGGSIRIYVSRVGGSEGAASVNYATANGSATAGSDYTATSGTLNWASGNTADKHFDVPIINDSVAEVSETFAASLSGASGASLGAPTTTTVTINGPNDQPTGTLQFTSATYTIGEDGGSVRLYVSRTGGSYGAASVNYATADGTAAAGSDYTTTSGTLNWAGSDAADKYFDVPVTDDALSEAGETFTATLSDATGAPLGTPTTTTVTITDNEALSDLALAVDCDSLTWATGGDADWFIQTVVTHDGEDAAQSGAIANGQESWMETTVIGPGTVTFWWKVSSETDCDYLEFYIGATLQDRISGDVDWQQQAYAVDPGVQTLRWRYVKDGASSEGSDCGWVDQVVFVEGGIPALEGLGDFNGDGFSDLLIREMLGPVWVRLMTGAATDQIGSPGSPDTTWVVEAVGDFNNDGMTDILWRNALTSDVAIWLMNGTAIQRAGLVGTPISDWAVHGVADFNGDGRDDILWRNAATDQVAIWIMRGTRLVGGRVTAAVNPDWQVRGTGDFNGNGKGDVLWQNTATGDVAIWLMNGTTISSVGIVACVDPASGWTAAGVGDLNGDGKSDIVWYHEATRQLAGWIMNGLRRRSADLIKDFTTGLAVTVPAGWTVQGIGDFNNNGKDDFLLHNGATGELQIWYMNKLRRLGLGTPDALW